MNLRLPLRSDVKARAIIYPDFDHKIPVEIRNKDIDPFIAEVLGPTGQSDRLASLNRPLKAGGNRDP